MVPALLTVVADCYGNSDILKGLRAKHKFILFASPAEQPIDGWPGQTLIYGYTLAKSLYEHISISDTYINDHTSWSFTEFESKSDVWIEEWIEQSLASFFKHQIVLGAYGEALTEQLQSIKEPVFVYNGNHNLYMLVPSNSDVYTWSHEEISYRLDVKSTSFAVEIINSFLARKLQAYIWDFANVESIDHPVLGTALSITDIAMAVNNDWLTKDDIEAMFHPTKQLSTAEFMIYVSRTPHLYIDPQEFEQEYFRDYACRAASATIDQLFSRAKIHINREKLLAEIKYRNKSGGEAGPLEKVYNDLDADGMVQIPYLSRNKITARIFPAGGSFNPVNVSDEALLSSITSRFDGGVLLSFDFEQFEPAIINHVLELNIVGDIHSKAASALGCSRDIAKNLNNMIFYGSSNQSLAAAFLKQQIDIESVNQYLEMMSPIITKINAAMMLLARSYHTMGYIKNPFGRIVRPRDESGLFNNYIQSTASDIFVKACWNVFELLRDYNSVLFMHRFDSLYIDCHPDEPLELIGRISSIMKTGFEIPFGVKITAGTSLANLKPLNL